MEERAELELRDEIERYADMVAADLGPAPGARQVSDAEKVRLWGQTDPRVDFDQLKMALMQGGLPPELLDEHGDRALAIVKSHPEIAQMYAQPLDDTMSTYLATLAEYPFRLSVLSQYAEDDPEGMVKEAERLDGLWQKQQGSHDVDRAETPPSTMAGG